MSTFSKPRWLPLMIRTSKSAVGSVMGILIYQLDFTMPGIWPRCAHLPETESAQAEVPVKERPRPQLRQRLWKRLAYFKVSALFATVEILATLGSPYAFVDGGFDVFIPAI